MDKVIDNFNNKKEENRIEGEGEESKEMVEHIVVLRNKDNAIRGGRDWEIDE